MIKLYWAICLTLASAVPLGAHPMGNFSVNHYTRIEPGQPMTKVLFVLDLAELPTFELLQRWGLQAASPHAELNRKAATESKVWTRQLQFTANGKRITPEWESADIVISDGAGGLPVLRVNTHLKVAAPPGTLHYADATYPDRTAGWKEVVSPGTPDRSQALTAYPQDPTLSPPQQLTADIAWKGSPAPLSKIEKPSAPAAEPVLVAQTPTASTVAEPDSMGQVKRGDFLSTTLKGKEIGWGVGLICVVVAFWFGALHALEPGHGKTMVAAYLVGERGTPKHALFLGGMVTFTHTISVFILGLLTMFLSQYIMADVISKWLGIISGLTIVWIGGLLFYRRIHALAVAAQQNERQHTHSHRGGRPHTHKRGVHAHTHTHDGHTHSHTIEGEISMKSLMALGASGGLVPCPSALVLLLAAVSVGRIGFGLLLLVSFSLGLALVLMATGLAVLYAKRLFPARQNKTPSTLTTILPIVSAAVIVVIGLVLTGNAMGLIPAIRFFG